MQALQWAVLRGDSERLHRAIERGGPGSIDSCSAFSPLSLAAGVGNYAITQYLLHEGAPVNRLHDEAGSPLYAASLAGHKEVVDLLLKHGADPSLCSTNGSSPLMVAASEGYLDIMQALLKNGSKVDEKDETGGTALYHAAAGGQAGAVHELLEGGRADHHVANGNGLTPLHAAMVARAKACVAMLQEAERVYALYKIRTLSEDGLKREKLPSWPLPQYYQEGRRTLPLVELTVPHGRVKGETADEIAAVLAFVVRGMGVDVYLELMDFLGRDGRQVETSGEADQPVVKVITEGGSSYGG